MDSFVFGPVPSRRLGFSLGVDIIPRKYCNFDCIYCQIGKTKNKAVARQRFFEPSEVVKEILHAAQNREKIDFITFSGSGEPTLNENLGAMIRELKESLPIPVAVITNGSLLNQEAVRDDLQDADVILPSLDAASDYVLQRVNRPASNISLQTIVDGIRSLRRQYHKPIWLEVMLVRGINDGDTEARKLGEILRDLPVDRIHLNTVTRPPSEKGVRPVGAARLRKIQELFGERCEVISSFQKSGVTRELPGWTETVMETLRRRSLTLNDLNAITGVPSHQLQSYLRHLERKGMIKINRLGNETYYSSDE